VACHHLERHQAAHAVTYDDGLVEPEFAGNEGDVIGESLDGVALIWRVALAETSEVHRDDAAGALQVLEERSQRAPVRSPSVHQNCCRIAAACFFIRERNAIPIQFHAVCLPWNPRPP
jgi:hypothetical protein